MAELIASSAGQADSADIALTAGASTTLYLKTASATLPRDAVALVQVKSGSNYFTVGQIDAANPMQVLTAVGTFRVRKLAAAETGSSFGVDRD